MHRGSRYVARPTPRLRHHFSRLIVEDTRRLQSGEPLEVPKFQSGMNIPFVQKKTEANPKPIVGPREFLVQTCKNSVLKLDSNLPFRRSVPAVMFSRGNVYLTAVFSEVLVCRLVESGSGYPFGSGTPCSFASGCRYPNCTRYF